MTYLANTPDNAWTLPAGETRDAVAFLAECESALRDVPEGTENTAFVARVGDLHLGEDFLRKDGRVVVLFATAHDDSGGELRFRLREDSAVVDLSVLVDDRLLGSSVPSGPRLCGTFSRSTPTWDPKRPPLPRLAALVNEVPWAELSIICSDSQEAGDVLFQDDRVIVDLFSPSLRRDGCAILVAPPVFGDDARCERPELGLRPATASEHRVATAQFGTRLEGHPLCRMTELGGQGGPGEGWYWAPDSGRPAFTPWAEPVVGSFVVLHCESPRCATDTLP